MGTKVAVAFANIFMVRNSFNCFYFSQKKASLVEKVYRSDDIFSLWDIGREQLITHFFKKTNSHHATINFTAEISENKISFLDTIVYKAN